MRYFVRHYDVSAQLFMVFLNLVISHNTFNQFFPIKYQPTFFSFLMGCANVPLNIFLIAGACCRKSCLIMPWIVITLLEHLIVGVPLIIFMGLISLYLAAQLHLYIQAACLMGFIITLFFLSMSSWVS